jgi:hypothetical protein
MVPLHQKTPIWDLDSREYGVLYFWNSSENDTNSSFVIGCHQK